MPTEIPCDKLSQLIGQAIEEGAVAQARSLEELYAKQCGGKKPKLAVPIGARASMRFADEAVFLNLVNEQGNVVTVIFGGSDGILITIDGKGKITVLPPEGPGDPEVRQAVASIRQAVEVLYGAALP